MTKNHRQFDFYETPTSAIQALIDADFQNKDLNIFDFSVGRGQILKVFGQNGFNNLFGSDLREQNIYGMGGVDFLQKKDAVNGVIVMNPPFNLAVEFIQKSLEICENEIYILQRLEFLASKTRQYLMNMHLIKLFILSKRPTFYPSDPDLSVDAPAQERKGGAKDYGWFCFKKNKESSKIDFQSI